MSDREPEHGGAAGLKSAEDPVRIKVFVVIEDEPDIRLLIGLTLGRDRRLDQVGEAASAAEALAMLDTVEPGLIILDHGIEGDVMGLQAAPLLKAKAPGAKILLFTAFDMQREADNEPAVDAYLRKDHFPLLLSTVQRLVGLEGDDDNTQPVTGRLSR